MLREADRFDAEVETAPAFTSAPALAVGGPAFSWTSTERYGQSRKRNAPIALIVIALHVALAAAFLLAKTHIVHHQAERLTVLNLMTPPPPPPPPSTPEPPKQVQTPVDTPIVAPKPIVETPVPAPALQTTPNPVPVPTPPSPPAAVAGPPAPSPAPPAMGQMTDMSDQALYIKAPRWTEDMAHAHEFGTVVLTVTLGYDGSVANVVVSKSSGHRRLDDAARDAVKKWRWKPQLRNGQPIMVQGVVEIPFVPPPGHGDKG